MSKCRLDPNLHTQQEYPGRCTTGSMSWGLGPCHSLPKGRASQDFFPISAPGSLTIVLLGVVWPKEPALGQLGLSGRRAKAGRGLRLVHTGENGDWGTFWIRDISWYGCSQAKELMDSGAEEATKEPSYPGKARSMWPEFSNYF